MTLLFRYSWFALLLFTADIWAQPAPLNVLLLLAYEPQYPEASIIVEQVDQAFTKQSTRPAQIAVEYMNADLGASPVVYQSIAALLSARQRERGHYDLVVVAGNNALKFVLTDGQNALAQTPIAFLNITDGDLVKSIAPNLPISGVMSVLPIYEFLAFSRFLYPGFSQLYIISDTLTERSEQWAKIQQASNSLNIHVHNLSLSQLSWKELGQKLEQIQGHPILLMSAFRDHLGQEKHMKEGIAFITKHSASPVWHLRRAGIGLGLAGGVITDLNSSADLAVSLALKQLANPQQPAPPVHWQPPLLTIADAEQTQRYGIRLQQLPKDTKVINPPNNLWQNLGLLGVLVVLLTLSSLALAALAWWQHRRRNIAEHNYQKHNELFQHILDASPNIIFYKDINGYYEFFNQQFTHFTKAHPLGKTDYDLFPSEAADLFRHRDQEALAQSEGGLSEEWVLDNQQVSRLLKTHRKPIYNQQQVLQGILGFSIDITAQRQQEERLKELEHYLYHDNLTNLLNKDSLFERLETLLAQAQERQQMLAVVYLDLDRFKDINDTLGHETGDELLKAVAQRLHNNINAREVCARLGSDEFILILEVQDFTQTQEKCDQLVALIARPYSLQGHLISIYASAGLCLYPQDGQECETLIRHADAALHKAKEQGRNRALRYHSTFTDQIQSRLSLEQDLHAAMEKRQFTLLYQPQFTREGNLHGTEALVRWQHPSRGIISPAEFIPLAENSGMMVELGFWILRTACQQFLFWREQGLHMNKIAVNVSPVQFTANFATRVAELLKSLNFNPQWLELEVTEGLMMSDTTDVTHQLQALLDLKVTLSVDDFGTGYSSLHKLKTMPVSALKIDRSFVRNLAVDNNDFKIVHAIIQMAQSLNLTTVAEGVETAEHELILQQLGCNLLQGYHYAKPMPAAEIFERYH